MIQEFIKKVRGTQINKVNLFAESKNISREHFSREFRLKTSTTAKAFISEINLLRASELLRTTSDKIVEIALECGWEDQTSFNRAFRNRFRKSPSSYRKELASMDVNQCASKISKVVLQVKDLAKSVEFYERILGFKSEFIVKEYQWAQFNAGGVDLCLSEDTNKKTSPVSTVLYISVPNIEVSYKNLKAHSTVSVSDLGTGDDGTKFFDVEDFDGHKFKLVQEIR